MWDWQHPPDLAAQIPQRDLAPARSSPRQGLHKEERERVDPSTAPIPVQIEMFRPRSSKSFPDLLPCRANVVQEIRRHERLFSDLFGRDVTGKTMKVHREQDTLQETAEVLLTENAGEHSGQDISHPRGSHSRITCGIDEHLTVRRCDDCSE